MPQPLVVVLLVEFSFALLGGGMLVGCSDFAKTCASDDDCGVEYRCTSALCIPLEDEANPEPTPTDGGENKVDGGDQNDAGNDAGQSTIDAGRQDAGQDAGEPEPTPRSAGTLCNVDSDCGDDPCVEVRPDDPSFVYKVCQPYPAENCTLPQFPATFCNKNGCDRVCLSPPSAPDKAAEGMPCLSDDNCALSSCVRTPTGDFCQADRELLQVGRSPHEEIRAVPSCAPPLRVYGDDFPICVLTCSDETDCANGCREVPLGDSYCAPLACELGEDCGESHECVAAFTNFSSLDLRNPFDFSACVGSDELEITLLEGGDFGCFPGLNDCTTGKCISLLGQTALPFDGVCQPSDGVVCEASMSEVTLASAVFCDPNDEDTAQSACYEGCYNFSQLPGLAEGESCTDHEECALGRCFNFYDESLSMNRSLCLSQMGLGEVSRIGVDNGGEVSPWPGCAPPLQEFAIDVQQDMAINTCLFPCENDVNALATGACALPKCSQQEDCSDITPGVQYRCVRDELWAPGINIADQGVCVSKSLRSIFGPLVCHRDDECGVGEVCDASRGFCATGCTQGGCDDDQICKSLSGLSQSICVPVSEDMPCNGNALCARDLLIQNADVSCNSGQKRVLMVDASKATGYRVQCQDVASEPFPLNSCPDSYLAVDFPGTEALVQGSMCVKTTDTSGEPFDLCNVNAGNCALGSCEPVNAPFFSNLHQRWHFGTGHGDPNQADSNEIAAWEASFSNQLGVCIVPCEESDSANVCVAGLGILPDAPKALTVSGGILVPAAVMNGLYFSTTEEVTLTNVPSVCAGPLVLIDGDIRYQNPTLACTQPSKEHAVSLNAQTERVTVVAPSYLAPMPTFPFHVLTTLDVRTAPAYCTHPWATESSNPAPFDPPHLERFGRARICIQTGNGTPPIPCGVAGDAKQVGPNNEYICPLAGVGFNNSGHVLNHTPNLNPEPLFAAFCASGLPFSTEILAGQMNLTCNTFFEGERCSSPAQCPADCLYSYTSESGISKPVCGTGGTLTCEISSDCAVNSNFCVYNGNEMACINSCSPTPPPDNSCTLPTVGQRGSRCAHRNGVAGPSGTCDVANGLACLDGICR